MITSVAATGDQLFTSHSDHSHGYDAAVVLKETISHHFMLSFSHNHFQSRLFCSHGHPYRPPALGITTTVSLFLSPITDSAPGYVQAHLISLVSEAIHIKNPKPDSRLTNCFLSTFEKSVILYTRHMSRVQTDGWGSASTSLEFYVSPGMKEKVDAFVSGLDGCFSRMESDLVGSSLTFVKDCQDVCTGLCLCQEEILSILSWLVLEASKSYSGKTRWPVEEEVTLQDLYLLASLLKLMSVSLLQAIRCVQRSGDLSL